MAKIKDDYHSKVYKYYLFTKLFNIVLNHMQLFYFFWIIKIQLNKNNFVCYNLKLKTKKNDFKIILLKIKVWFDLITTLVYLSCKKKVKLDSI